MNGFIKSIKMFLSFFLMFACDHPARPMLCRSLTGVAKTFHCDVKTFGIEVLPLSHPFIERDYIRLSGCRYREHPEEC